MVVVVVGAGMDEGVEEEETEMERFREEVVLKGLSTFIAAGEAAGEGGREEVRFEILGVRPNEGALERDLRGRERRGGVSARAATAAAERVRGFEVS